MLNGCNGRTETFRNLPAQERIMSDLVVFEHTLEGFTIKTGHPLLEDIHADYTRVSPEQRMGTARVFLVSAALNCFCGTLNAALIARNVRYRRMIGTGRAEREERNGASCVTRICMDVCVEVDDADAETLAQCLEMVKSCMITRSLMNGIEIDMHAARA